MIIFVFKSQGLLDNYLINGLVTAKRVLINQEGCTMIRDFRFFRNLEFKKKENLEISTNSNINSKLSDQ
jgi:hypothetical protein